MLKISLFKNEESDNGENLMGLKNAVKLSRVNGSNFRKQINTRNKIQREKFDTTGIIKQDSNSSCNMKDSNAESINEDKSSETPKLRMNNISGICYNKHIQTHLNISQKSPSRLSPSNFKRVMNSDDNFSKIFKMQSNKETCQVDGFCNSKQSSPSQLVNQSSQTPCPEDFKGNFSIRAYPLMKNEVKDSQYSLNFNKSKLFLCNLRK